MDILKLLGFLLFVLLLVWLIRRLMHKPKRKGVLQSGNQLPISIVKLLEQEVGFYQQLSDKKKEQFKNEMARFLSKHQITGLGADIDELTVTLVGASAIIPIFNFPNWEYPNLGDILIYPESVEKQETYDGSTKFDVLGQLSSSSFDTDVVKLSKRDLINGFRNGSKHNVGVHEFTHLMDKSDGKVDGLPKAFVSPELIKVWSDRIHLEIKKIKTQQSKDIDAYGATSDAEFFAVVTEYFFQQPERLHQKHPELYRLLDDIFDGKV